MVTVEELAHKLGYYIEGDDIGSGNALLNELLDTAKKEYERGRAEGAEQERERIRRMQLCGYRVQVSQFPDDERRHCRVETGVYGVAYTLVPASVLSPAPKEEK